MNTCIALVTTRKNQLSMFDYFAKMRGYADEMASTGNAITNEEFVSYVLAGLDEDYNSIFTAVVARIDTVTSAELYTQLLSFEQHLTLQVASHGGPSSALVVSCDLIISPPLPSMPQDRSTIAGTSSTRSTSRTPALLQTYLSITPTSFDLSDIERGS
jgi:hypothetical protein